MEMPEKEVRTLAMNRNCSTALTYLDSGANNHCFANNIDFSTYTAFSIPQYSQVAIKNGKFHILGKGSQKNFLTPKWTNSNNYLS